MKKMLALVLSVLLLMCTLPGLADGGEVRVLLSDAEAHAYLEGLAADFKAQYGYDLKLTLVANGSGADYDTARETQIAAGQVDIVVAQQFSTPQEEWNAAYAEMPAWQQYVTQGLFADLTNYDFTKRYNASTLETVSWDGKVYALPIGVSAYNGMFYNCAIFNELGLSVPQTWDELITCMETIKQAGYQVVTLGMSEREYALKSYLIYSLLGSWFGDDVNNVIQGLVTGEIKHTDPEITEIYTALDTFCSYCVENVTGVTKSSAIAQFSTGTVALFVEATWSNSSIATAVDGDFEFGYFAIPGKEARSDGLAPQFAVKTDNSWVMPTTAPNPEGAIAFLEWVSSDEVYQGLINTVEMSSTVHGISVQSDFLASLEYGMQDVRSHAEQSIYAQAGIGEYGDWLGFKMLYAKTMGGPLTVEELAQKAADDFATWQTAMGLKE